MTERGTVRLSIIIPVLNEAEGIVAHLQSLQSLRQRGHELIVVDGGSEDSTLERVSDLADRILVSARGRARQMNAGAAVARHAILLFVHADTRLPADADQAIAAACTRQARWGHFRLRLSGSHWMLRTVERCINLRTRITGIVTGDLVIFVERALFREHKGFADIPLMEDVEFSKRLRRLCRPAALDETVVSDSRRWERQGILRTIVLMWRLRLAYFLGADPETLVQRYYPQSTAKAASQTVPETDVTEAGAAGRTSS